MIKRLRQARTWMKSFIDDKSGASFLVFALTLPVLVGFLGIGAEIAYWYVNQRNMQSAADFGAFTTAIELRGKQSAYYAINQGKAEALNNGAKSGWDTITINIPPLSGPVRTVNAAEAIIVRSLPRLFSGIFIKENMSIRARGVAQWQEGGTACILALDREAKNAVTVSGNADVLLDGCDIQSNSSNAQAAIINGSALLTTGCINASGGISYTSGLTLTECSQPGENMALVDDPFANLPMPDLSDPCMAKPAGSPKTAKTYLPGRYCGGMALQGPTTFEPGTYIIDGGNFTINSTAVVNGAGVTFVLTGGGTVKMNGAAEIHLTAPKTGTYAGILFYQDRDELDASNFINGNSFTTFEGVFYFPSQEVIFNGNSASGPGCMLVVSNEVTLTGSTSFGNTCNPADHAFYGLLKTAGYVRLVD